MFKSIKKIKDKLYFLYIDKIVNNPNNLKEYDKLSRLDIDDKHISTFILENDFANPQEAIEDIADPVAVELEAVSEKIDPVEEIPKKKPGRPKSTAKTATKSTTKKVPSKKIDPSS